jgi:lipopolysaccharide/colanic/teichoic acid biosynthesis glycosyltransferase
MAIVAFPFLVSVYMLVALLIQLGSPAPVFFASRE